jgi:hypothetical protein
VFRDDSLATFLRRVYRQYAEGVDGTEEFELNMRVTALLSEAKSWCVAREARVADPLAPRVVNGSTGVADLTALNGRAEGMERV